MTDPTGTDLHARLVAAKLAGHKAGNGYYFRSNEQAANFATEVVASWLRELGQEVQANWPEGHDAAILAALRSLADLISPDSTVEPAVTEEQILNWPLWTDEDDTGIWCGDEDCPIQGASSQILERTEDGDFTLAELREAVKEHITYRQEREAES